MISRDSLKGITSVIAVRLPIFQIYFTAGFGIIDSQLLRTIHLGIGARSGLPLLPPQEASGRRAGTPRLAGAGFWSLIPRPSPPRPSSPPTSTTTWNASGMWTPCRTRKPSARPPPSCSCWKRRAGWRGCRWSSWRARSLPTALAGSICPEHPPARRRHLQDALRTAVSRDRRAVRHSAGGVLHHDLRLRHVRVLPPAGGIGAGLSRYPPAC